MRIASRIGSPSTEAANDVDPREDSSAEIIDFASRSSYPQVSQRKGKSDTLGLLAGISVVALLGIATLWGMNAARTGDEAQPAAGMQQPAAALSAPATQPVAPVQPSDTSQAQPAPAAQAGYTPAAVYAQPPQAALENAANRYGSPTVIYDSSALPAPVGPVTTPAGNDSSTQAGTAGDFASRIGGVGGSPATAARNFDPATTVTQGTLIPAVLETAINTDVPGFARAIVSQDVRSYDGRRILVPRSSRLIGQYQSGLQNGQKRAYVIWTRLIRPDGVSVALASPATDFAGSTGLPGKVDNHFFKRFGSAMLLSVIGGLTTIASGGGSIIMGGGESAAAAAIGQGKDIAPTVRVRQGEPIRVFTARDLDFSTAPRL